MGVWWIFLMILLSVDTNIAHGELPCHFLDSVNITDGLPLPDQSIQLGDIIYPRSQYATISYVLEDGTENITVNPYIRGCICNLMPCLRLCCPLGTIYSTVNGTTDCQNHENGRDFHAEVIHENKETKILPLQQHFGYVEGSPCEFIMGLNDDYNITHVRII